jgi:Two component regulator propeller
MRVPRASLQARKQRVAVPGHFELELRTIASAEKKAMTSVGIRTARVLDGRALRLMLIVLAATSGQGTLAQALVPGGQRTIVQDRDAPVRDLRFTHLTTNDGLSQSYVTAIVQDRRGFMWFATRDGLNRYDGNAFAVYKNNPSDPGSLSSNFIQDLKEDDHGSLWIATNTGVNRFDPTTERCIRYLHEPDNANTIGGASVKSIAVDRRGYLWFGTEDGGLDKLDPRTGRFTQGMSL